MNTGFLVCDKCQDGMNYQQSLLILPPDPPVIFNTRPENYTVDESNWLTTQDGEIITDDAGDPITTSIPNPSDNANTAHITSSITYASGSVAVAYLDIFNGDPASGGVSVLELITGSATRTNIASSLETGDDDIALNTVVITVSSECENTVNISHVAIYDAATAGTLLCSGTASVSQLPVAEGLVVQFNALALSINLS